MMILRAAITCSLLVIAATLSCGKKDDPASGGQEPLPLTATEQIAGEWSGIYRGLEDSRPTSDAYMIQVSFNSNGQFLLANSNDSAAYVRGTWSEFQGKNLLISITNSTIPKVGTAGAILEFGYDLVGTQLRFGGANFEVKVAKKSVTNPTQPTSEALIGRWHCEAPDHRVTVVEFLDTSEFRLSSQKQGERVYIAKGTAEASGEHLVRMTVAQSSEALAQNTYFSFAISGVVGRLTLVSGSDRKIEMGTCRK